MIDQVRTWERLRERWRNRIRVITSAAKRPSAKDSILAYLQIFLDEDVRNYELLVVSGIAEYARRVRELAVEDGYHLLRSDHEDVPRGHYRLISPEPDAARAAAWATASQIRKTPGSHKKRILAFLRANVGVPLTHDMLQYVGKGKDTRERLRDLRITDGWRIATRRTGRPDLRNDEYLLVSDEPLPPHDRKIPAEVYEAVLERDGRRCRKCNWTPNTQAADGKRHSLEVHHIEHFARGGTHEEDNLITLCDLDHDVAHRDEIEGARSLQHWLAKRPRYWVTAT